MIYSNDPIEFCVFIPKNICRSLRAWVTEQMQSARTLIIFYEKVNRLVNMNSRNRMQETQSNMEISLHHSQTVHFGFPNGPFQRAKWTVWRPKTDRFRTQNGMY